MKPILFLLLSAFTFNLSYAQTSVGIFEGHGDVGNPRMGGSAVYNAADQSYLLNGAGYNIWFNRDEFQYAYRKIGGDFILTADFAFTGDTAGTIGHRKTGWMIRESLDADAAGINACKHIDGLTAMQWREMRGAYMQDPQGEIFFPKHGGQTIRLERIGKTIRMWAAHPGEPLQYVGAHDMPDLPDSVLVGVYVCSHDSNTVAQARIWNVRIDKPVPNAYYPNPITARKHLPSAEVLGSRLEIMDVSTGERKVIYQSAGRCDSPTWTNDGKEILFNQGGYLYTLSPEGGIPEKSPASSRNMEDYPGNGKYIYYTTNATGTMEIWRMRVDGSAKEQVTFDQYHNWFPHLSPDGKWIVFLSYSGDIEPGSHPWYQPVTLKIMPAAGGAPRAIAYLYGGEGTLNGPCWSPDSKHIVFVSNGQE